MKNFQVLRHSLDNAKFNRVAFDTLNETNAFMMGSQWYVKESPTTAVNVETGDRVHDHEDRDSIMVSFDEHDPYGLEGIGVDKLYESVLSNDLVTAHNQVMSIVHRYENALEDDNVALAKELSNELEGYIVDIDDPEMRSFIRSKLKMQMVTDFDEENMLDETPANNVSGGAIDGAGPGDKPPGPHSRFAGCGVFRVDPDTYSKCRRGPKGPAERWENIVDMSTGTGRSIVEYSYNNPGESIILQNEKDGSMVYVKKGSKKT